MTITLCNFPWSPVQELVTHNIYHWMKVLIPSVLSCMTKTGKTGATAMSGKFCLV